MQQFQAISGTVFFMKIIDKYIIKRYLATFSVMVLLFIPIAIVINLSEKINKILENKAPLAEVIEFYGYFTIYFANMLFPIFLFLSVIWFTSKLANNTEVIAILSSGISFKRYLQPFLVSATIVAVFVLLMGFFIVPIASKGYNDFNYKYLKNNTVQSRTTENIYRQISPTEYIYVSNYNYQAKEGYQFVYEKFVNDSLSEKIMADRISYNPKEKNYNLYNYVQRKVGYIEDTLDKGSIQTKKFNFEPDDLAPVIYIAETMNLGELHRFIKKEQERGGQNINTYLVVYYRKFSAPVAAFILTIIAVAVASFKRRGGMGINLAIGIVIAFTFIFFDKIFGTMAEKSDISPLVAVWLPNVVFGILAFYLLKNAKQ